LKAKALNTSVRHLMEAVDQVRRDEIREKGKEHKELMKDSRYI
jgi:hypothetical protein